MRGSRFVAYGSVALAMAALVACAASGDNAQPAPTHPEEHPTPVPDDGGAAPQADAEPDASVEAPRCSEAGWCTTALPDVDLLMKDIWVLPSRAVAVAESPTLGVKVLEWTDAASGWSYIDDGTQNESGLGRFVGKIWMPDENEVYYAVSPGYIFHGTRTPQATWSWTADRLANSAIDANDGNPTYSKRSGSPPVPSLGVWGTGRDDVYAWFKDTIYHRESVDGAPPEWLPEYTASDSDFPGSEKLLFFGAAGASADDIWFAGARARSFAGCALLVRKHSSVYERVADGALASDFGACAARPGAMLIRGAEGWLTDIQAFAPGDVVALKGARDVVRIGAEGDAYSVNITPIPTTASTSGLNSLTTIADDLWLGGNGLVVQGSNIWDGGTFRPSTIWRDGTPITTPIWQVRGSSNTNLWAIGVRNALHKTTP